MKRPVIIHFHLFKNAGSSLDAILEQNFGSNWGQIESPNLEPLKLESLIGFIRNNPKINAVSTHTALVRVPELKDLKIIPLCFVRHPLDRIRSAYDFEKTQNIKAPSVIQAKQGSFRAYMDWYLASPPAWQVSNFHAFHFKNFHYPFDTDMENVERLAINAVLDMPWLGLVEKFDESVERFARRIKEYFPDFKTQRVNKNRTTCASSGLKENLAMFRSRIGDKTYRELEDLNSIDIKLYEIVKRRFV